MSEYVKPPKELPEESHQDRSDQWAALVAYVWCCTGTPFFLSMAQDLQRTENASAPLTALLALLSPAFVYGLTSGKVFEMFRLRKAKSE